MLEKSRIPHVLGLKVKVHAGIAIFFIQIWSLLALNRLLSQIKVKLYIF